MIKKFKSAVATTITIRIAQKGIFGFLFLFPGSGESLKKSNGSFLSGFLSGSLIYLFSFTKILGNATLNISNLARIVERKITEKQ